MSILTMLDYVSAARQTVHINKSMSATIIGAWTTGWTDASAGSDPNTAGSVTLVSTASGNVPTDATAGAPNIQDFSGVGYVSRVDALIAANSSAVYIMVADRLFECGSFAWNAGTVTLSSQPSYSSRIPGGDYSGTILAIEKGATSGSGPASITVTYTNQSGATGQSTGSYTLKTSGATSDLIQFLPLAAGDSGVQKVEGAVLVGGSSGNINIIVLRPIVRVALQNLISISSGIYVPTSKGLETCGMRRIYQDSCLMVLGNGSVPVLDATIEIVSG